MVLHTILGLNDTMEGNEGMDTLYGGAGDDLYLFTQGDGQDTFIEHSGVDTLRIMGIEQSDQLSIRRIGPNGEDLLIQFTDEKGQLTGDQITLKQVYDQGIVTPNLIENIELVNTEGVSTQLSIFELNSLYQSLDFNRLFGMEGEDTLQGTEANELLEGAGGNDHLIGNQGDDHLNGNRSIRLHKNSLIIERYTDADFNCINYFHVGICFVTKHF